MKKKFRITHISLLIAMALLVVMYLEGAGIYSRIGQETYQMEGIDQDAVKNQWM